MELEERLNSLVALAYSDDLEKEKEKGASKPNQLIYT